MIKQIIEWWNEDFWENFFKLCAILFVLGLGWAAYNAIVASNKVTFCYIELNRALGDPYYLVGNIEWREDRFLGGYESLQEAQAAKENTDECKQ